MSKIQGGSLEWNGDELVLFTGGVMVKAVTKASIFLQGGAKEEVGGVGKGRLYRRRKQKGKRGSFRVSDFHRASAPGDPPARDTGILANSVSFTVKQRTLKITGSVGSDIDKIRSKEPTTDPEYGVYLELGTSDIAPRPWLRPSLIKAKPTINKILNRAAGSIR
jgi:hypothetical protein